MGLFLGPLSWYFSIADQADYDEFVADAQKSKGVIYKKFSEFRGKSTNFYVAVRYNTGRRYITLAHKVKVEPALNSNLEKGDEVVVYYKNGGSDVCDIKFEGEMDSENIGPLYRPGVGIAYTFLSYSSLFAFLFFKRGNDRRREEAKEQ